MTTLPSRQRILQNSVATISSQILDSTGAAASPTDATVTITRADGTIMADAEPAVLGASSVFSYVLSTAETALLDRLTIEWTATNVGTTITYVEIVGGFFFTVPEARLVKPLDETSTYTASSIVEMRTTVEDAIEEYTGPLVPRYALETFSGRSSRYYGTYANAGPVLTKPYVRTIRSVMMDDTALTSSELALLDLNGASVTGYPWTTGYHNVTIGYEYGRDYPPERIKRAALLLAKSWLVAGPVDDRTQTFTSTEGGTYALATPGRGGSIFGLPEVDAAVQAEALPAIG